MVIDNSTNFEDQHKGINKLFKEYQEMKVKDLKRAKEIFEQFASNLQRHMLWEERILFPILISEGSGNTSHAVEVIKNEHKKILELLKHLYLKVSKDEDSKKEEEDLISALIKHEEFEDDVLHPVIERSSEKNEAFEAIIDIPKEELQDDFSINVNI